ncbi:MAG: outer membrane immunogenic protein [Candidatus Tokpelaia sp. JSC161]|nr:MAG: outer membrane immunogenic protein [Candidatus Tokpelaia sp. JSC161]
MKIKYLLTASAFALAASSQAQAADIVRPSELENTTAVVSTPQAFSWEGFYGGGQIGYSLGTAKSNSSLEKPKISPFATDSNSKDSNSKDSNSKDSNASNNTEYKTKSLLGGIYAGYNFDADLNTIIGLETDFLFNTNTQKQKDDELVKQKWSGSTRAKAGYAVDHFLPYVAAGISYTNLTFANSGETKTYAGWTIGSGIDYAVTNNILIRAEYRYNDFGKKAWNEKSDNFQAQYGSNDFRFGVAYKF